ncbi:MAG: NYN domain-containing protein [Candidatus Saccharimonadales bacterium]
MNNKSNFAFIDSQNLNMGVRSLGWKLDYRKFRLYLKNKYNVTDAFVFIGLIDNNQQLYTYLQKAGYILVFKPTIQYELHGKQTVKGNVDAELVLHAAAIQYHNYDKAIIVSGDGDFSCLISFLLEKTKLLNIIVPSKRMSKLLKPFSNHIVHLDKLRSSLAFED